MSGNGKPRKRHATGDPAVGARIRAAREKEQLTQAELADHILSTQGLISHYETGHTAVPTAALRRIAAAVKESAAYLLTGERGVAGELQAFDEAVHRLLSRRALRRLRDLTPAQRQQVIMNLGALIEAMPENGSIKKRPPRL